MAKKFAAFDIDGTLIRWQLYHAIADRLAKLGYVDTVAFNEIREARMDWKRRTHSESFKEYEIELVKLYERILKELNVGHFEEAAESVFEEYKEQVYTYTRTLLKELKAKDYLLFAISGSQTEIVKKIADYYGFDDFAGSTYVQQDERFTGELHTALGKKDIVLKRLAKKHQAGFKDSIAVGDGAGDIAMLEIVENPIAFNPERKLFEEASKQGWKIVIERKNMVYELEQGSGKYQLAKTNA